MTLEQNTIESDSTSYFEPQNQPKSKILFHENCSPRDLCIMILCCRPEGVFAPNPSDCNSFLMCNHGKYILRPCQVGIIQEFLYKFGMKPLIDLVEIITFSLYHVIIRPTKIISNLLKGHKLIFKLNYHS